MQFWWCLTVSMAYLYLQSRAWRLHYYYFHTLLICAGPRQEVFGLTALLLPFRDSNRKYKSRYSGQGQTEQHEFACCLFRFSTSEDDLGSRFAHYLFSHHFFPVLSRCLQWHDPQMWKHFIFPLKQLSHKQIILHQKVHSHTGGSGATVFTVFMRQDVSSLCSQKYKFNLLCFLFL